MGFLAVLSVCLSSLVAFVAHLWMTERAALRRNDAATKELDALKALPGELKTKLLECELRLQRLESLRLTR